ncbi:ribonuclease HIII [Leuconostoc palmae]|uniref:ribonuclease HIII n=1 Tax=Leuconostoc palmae TaxID=501487 RepID=UPI001C7CFD11|nr:ribonuclease HIII [Leuconostoc palmae]
MQSVIQVSMQQLKIMADYYQQFSIAKIPVGAIFSAKTNHGVVTGYKSGKILFQGNGFEKELSRWQSHAITPNNALKPKKTFSKTIPGENIPANFSEWSVLGSDEVGAGAYFGPLTTAAVYVSKENLSWVKQLGIADSKTLTDDKMRQIAPQIIENLPHHVVNLMPEKYNQLQPKHNVNQMKAISHNYALNKVLQKISPDQPQGILIDQFAQKTTYYNYLYRAQQSPIVKDNVYFSTKGEQYHLSVAAASILARVVELNALEELSAKAGIVLPIGAGKPVDLVAAKLIKSGQDLKYFAKLHFANTQKAQHLIH